ncbi:3-keto-disaccharide hydrolase [Rubritalea tangerina]|uniref:DUF1080 domain-containing protein n=1 Tax=Rubritalea tangerina TaxID=430798 RepID=A0ABW4ZDG4_9BACT
MKLIKTLIVAGLCSQLSLAEEGFIELFNGKDLTGWQGEGYEVKDGAIYCTPKGKNLMTAKEYSNYVLDFEFKLPPGGNNGLGIHYPGKGDAAYVGLELQILDDTAKKYAKLKDSQYHGGIYQLQAAKRGHLKPVGEWNKQRVIVNGNHVTIELNGVVINDANLDELAEKFPKHKGVKRRSGFVTFCGHGDPVGFRNIKIKDTTLPEVDLTGFSAMYDGKSLAGWKQDPGHEGHWQPRGEVLYYDSQSKAKDKNLWTEKSYKDFTMVFDWRWADYANARRLDRPVLDPATGEAKKDANGKAITKNVIELDSGIYMRGNNRSQVNLWNWPCGSGEVYGYRTNRNFSQEIRAALTPKVPADNPIGAWNRMAITLKGDRLTVVLNGKTVIENAQLPGVPAEGPIALQHHGSALEFKKLYIKEL